MANKRDYYEVLGVDKNADESTLKKTIDEIKRKNNNKSNKPCPVCSHKNNKHRR